MKLGKLRIKNWRSIKNLEISFQDLMIFIGQNNHGKSNVLSAILFFFGEIKAHDLDFNYGAQDLFVEAVFTDLDEIDKITFKKYLRHDGTIEVRKSAYIGGSFEYRGFLENPVDDWLKESNASSFTKREVASGYPFHEFLPRDGRLSKQNIIDAQNKYITSNLASVSFNFELEETNFLGLKSVAKGIFGDVYFIPAVKDATEDFTTKEASAFGKLYAAIIEAMSASNTDWKETKEKLRSLFGTLNRRDVNGVENANRPKELTEFEHSLSRELASWGAEINVEVLPPNIDEVFRANTQVWIDDGMRTDIRRKGHGLQRALTFALIKVVSERIKKEQERLADGDKQARSASASTYFILEEPELYLHPQAQRSLFDTLASLSESKNQVILCTHASTLIDVERYKSICIVRKDDESRGTEVYQCFDDVFSGDGKKDFNLSYWINPDRSELFFARRVVLVEGSTDKTCIPLLAKRLGVFRYDYTLIDCGSKDNIPLYVQLLNKFKIPYVVVYDLDHQAHKAPDAIRSADKSTAQIVDVVDDALGISIVLNNDIEEELGIVGGQKNKPYAALVHIDSASFKLSSALEEKVRQIYA